MGFKCPLCGKDFYKDRIAWSNHCKSQHLGAGELIVDAVVNICTDNTDNKKKKIKSKPKTKREE